MRGAIESKVDSLDDRVDKVFCGPDLATKHIGIDCYCLPMMGRESFWSTRSRSAGEWVEDSTRLALWTGEWVIAWREGCDGLVERGG